MLIDGKIRKLTEGEYSGRSNIPIISKIFRYDHLLSSGASNQDQNFFTLEFHLGLLCCRPS